MKAGGRHGRPRTSLRLGCVGPSHLAHKSKLELTRIAVRLLRQLEGRRAEVEGKPPISAQPRVPQRIRAILKAKEAETNRRRAILTEIVEDYVAAHRCDPTPEFLSESMSRRLGVNFSKEQLYRHGLIETWRPDADFFGRQDLDRERGASDFFRRAKPRLVAAILRMQRELNEVEDRRRTDLRDQSRRDGWSLSEILPDFDEELA